MTRIRFAVLLTCCLLPLSCSGNPNGVTLQGSGATFPAPLYKRWFLEFYEKNPDVRVSYQAIGSGAGIRQFIEGLTVFGASDAAMTDKEIAAAEKAHGEKVVLLPMTAGSVAVCYNIPGLPKDHPPLRLSREVLADVFLGEIDSWDDSRIQADNPGLQLPAAPISTVHRSEGSGTTYAFTNHLQAISKTWREKVGKAGKSWGAPGGLGAKGNNGVAALIEQTPGAIGYVEFGYAEMTKLPMAAVQNKAGRFVQPDPTSGQAALAAGRFPDDAQMKANKTPEAARFRLFIADPAGEKSYPVVTYTWMLLLKRYPGKQAGALKKVLHYCLSDGQKVSNELGYIPLPEKVATMIRAAVDQIETR
jgi:phosphate transport system substrate-binding protein